MKCYMWNVNDRLMESDTFVFNKRLTSCFWDLSCPGTYVYHVYTYIIYIVWKMIKVTQQIFRDRLITFALPCKESKKLQERSSSPVEFSKPLYSHVPLFFPPLITDLLLGEGCVFLHTVWETRKQTLLRESEEGALGWVSGGRRHLTTAQPWSPGFSEQKGKN